VDSENLSGALQLYQNMGFQPVKSTGNEPLLSQESLLSLDARQPFLHKDYALVVRDFDEEIAVVNVLVLVSNGSRILCPVVEKSPRMCLPVSDQ
jgi:hypothetical protein